MDFLSLSLESCLYTKAAVFIFSSVVALAYDLYERNHNVLEVFGTADEIEDGRTLVRSVFHHGCCIAAFSLDVAWRS